MDEIQGHIDSTMTELKRLQDMEVCAPPARCSPSTIESLLSDTLVCVVCTTIELFRVCDVCVRACGRCIADCSMLCLP